MTEWNKIYNALKEAYLPNKRCAVFPDKEAAQIHHIKGRSIKAFADETARQKNTPLLVDVRWFLPVSAEGHEYIHANPKEARDRGFLL